MPKRKPLNPLFALMLGLPLTALADTDNVSIYGVANASWDIIDTGTSTAGVAGANITKVSSNATRLGFKGKEDLGGGLSAIWQIESLIAMDNAGGTFGTRNTYAGLSSSDYGTLLLGRNDTPYKISTRRLDSFGDTIADNRTLFGTVTGLSTSWTRCASAARRMPGSSRAATRRTTSSWPRPMSAPATRWAAPQRPPPAPDWPPGPIVWGTTHGMSQAVTASAATC